MNITTDNESYTYITLARTSKEGGTKGISAFIVEKDTPGLTIGKNEKKMGLRGSSTVELIFDQCIVPKQQIFGEKGHGFNIAMANLNIGRFGIAVPGLGIGEAIIDHY